MNVVVIKVENYFLVRGEIYDIDSDELYVVGAKKKMTTAVRSAIRKHLKESGLIYSKIGDIEWEYEKKKLRYTCMVKR